MGVLSSPLPTPEESLMQVGVILAMIRLEGRRSPRPPLLSSAK